MTPKFVKIIENAYANINDIVTFSYIDTHHTLALLYRGGECKYYPYSQEEFNDLLRRIRDLTDDPFM